MFKRYLFGKMSIVSNQERLGGSSGFLILASRAVTATRNHFSRLWSRGHRRLAGKSLTLLLTRILIIPTRAWKLCLTHVVSLRRVRVNELVHILIPLIPNGDTEGGCGLWLTICNDSI